MGNPDITPEDFAHDPARMPLPGVMRSRQLGNFMQRSCVALSVEDFHANPDLFTMQNEQMEMREADRDRLAREADVMQQLEQEMKGM